ncbi:MAG TPA: SPOR domain-containing protein, partial [Phaeodactylibacter sp.]|nr:SPOR domain-containing protein [Phaeodactylibacter sp.]
SNAENMVRKLRNMGYDDARTELFDRGAYAVALVDHYPDYTEAQRIASELKEKGVSAYVKKK